MVVYAVAVYLKTRYPKLPVLVETYYHQQTMLHWLVIKARHSNGDTVVIKQAMEAFDTDTFEISDETTTQLMMLAG